MSMQTGGIRQNGRDKPLDAVIVGAGFAGMYMLHRLRGMGFTARVFEAGSGVGGTWYWNRYPGARCDVESVQYSYQFDEALQQEWEWSERYAAQPELLRYANHVADRFDLRRDIAIQHARDLRRVRRRRGTLGHRDRATAAHASATFCIMATGCLSSPNLPQFEGIERFKGERYHTGYWPHEGVDFTGQAGGRSSARAPRPCSRSRSSRSRPSTCTCSSARPTTPSPRTMRRSIPSTSGRSRPTIRRCGRAPGRP